MRHVSKGSKQAQKLLDHGCSIVITDLNGSNSEVKLNYNFGEGLKVKESGNERGVDAKVEEIGLREGETNEIYLLRLRAQVLRLEGMLV